MKLALVVGSYPPRVGGLEQHLGNLAQGLSDLGVEVTVFTIGDEPSMRRDGQVKVLTDKRYFPVADIISFPPLGATKRLTKALKKGGFDAVSTHTRFFPMSFIGSRAAKKAGIPVVHTEHGSGFVVSKSLLIHCASRLVDQTMGRRVLATADQVLGVSDEASQFATQLGAENTRVFFNAIPATDPPTCIIDRPNHLVFVGRVVYGKGWDTFLKVISALRTEGYDVDGELLGDGEDLEDAKKLAEELGLDQVVRIPGRVTSDEVRRSLCGATLVNPTILSEGFGVAILEALAEQGRVVTYSAPGARVLQDQGAPVLVVEDKTSESLVSSLRELLSDAPPIAPPEFISEWTWPRRSKEYLEILEEVLVRSR